MGDMKVGREVFEVSSAIVGCVHWKKAVVVLYAGRATVGLKFSEMVKGGEEKAEFLPAAISQVEVHTKSHGHIDSLVLEFSFL